MNKIHASIFACFSGLLLFAHSVTAADPFGLDRLGVRAGPDNADIHDTNPSLNLQTLGIDYSF